ncbi:MAG TPA: hypothetical protein VEL31_17475 [Ktedonobacteraceae bacterium]|nr:hypothetical protein [Ktedonobacteraceae bacterium]
MQHFSLNELHTLIEQEDLLLECAINIRVNVSMEHPHRYVKDDTGNVKLVLDKGWLVSLGLQLPSSEEEDSRPFSDGEPLMVCDLRYLGEYFGPVQLEDAIRALGVDPDAKIWKQRLAS